VSSCLFSVPSVIRWVTLILFRFFMNL
jgi:hypothetical protein